MNKNYSVLIDMKYSKEYIIRAKNQNEAKKKAWEKFIKRIPKNLFEKFTDEI